MSYLAFLAFIVATGLYWVMGPGGPLHSLNVLAPFQDQLSGREGESSSTRTLLWLVVLPSVAFALVYAILEIMFGGAAMLLVGTAALFFAFGREDYPTITQRFLARARAGDNEGAAMVLEAAGANSQADDVNDFADVATSFFCQLSLQRWFGPVTYFLLLGPVGAVAYRLAHLTQSTETPVSESIIRIIEWLPSRLMAVVFSVFGDFDKTASYLMGQAVSLERSTAEFFEDACDAALEPVNDGTVHKRISGLLEMLERGFLLWLAVIALLVLI